MTAPAPTHVPAGCHRHHLTQGLWKAPGWARAWGSRQEGRSAPGKDPPPASGHFPGNSVVLRRGHSGHFSALENTRWLLLTQAEGPLVRGEGKGTRRHRLDNGWVDVFGLRNGLRGLPGAGRPAAQPPPPRSHLSHKLRVSGACEKLVPVTPPAALPAQEDRARAPAERRAGEHEPRRRRGQWPRLVR